MEISLNNIFTLLSESVGLVPTSTLIEECKKLGMKEQPYNDFGMDSDLPEFDNGFRFLCLTDDNQEAFFEILDKNSEILQAGFQVIYRSDFFGKKYKRHCFHLFSLLENQYGEGIPMDTPLGETVNYGAYSGETGH